MTALSMVGASGIAAAWTRPLTALALTKAAVPRNSLRENILSLRSVSAAGRRSGGGYGRWIFSGASDRSAAVDGSLQVGLRQPERAPGVDGRAQRGDALACFRQKCEDVDLHRGKPQLHLLADDLAQRKDLALIVPGDIVGRSVDAVCVARFRAYIDGLLGEAVECLIVGFRSLPDANFASVEDRNLKQHVETAFPERRGIWVARLPVDAGNVEQRDEACCLGEIERLRKRCKFHAGDLKIDPMSDRVNLDSGQRQWTVRQGRQLLRQPEAEIAVPQSEQSDQSLPGACRILSKRRQVGRRLRVEHLFTGLIELVQRPGLPELFRKLCSGF